MPDYTDLELAKMEKQLNKIYKQAQGEIQEKWDKYMVKAQAKADKAQNDYIKALTNGDPNKANKAKDQYEKTMLNMTLQNEHYQAMINQVTDKLADTNQIALSYLNDQMPKIYCHSFNEFAAEKIKGYSFELVNEQTVKNLIKDGNKSLLPQKTLNIPKDKKWNTKNINSQVLQGILQGESIDKISKRLQNVTDMNHNSAVRNARTMTTGAENKGRQDSFIRAKNHGIIMKKRWVVAHDARLRDWHAELGGVEVEVEESFENDYGEILYPGDPSAHPANVYNCRCAMRAVVMGFKPMKKPVGIYAEQYKDVGMTKQYYAMLDEDKALGNEFWKILKAAGKPSEVWGNYILGTGPKTVAKQLDDILAKYKGTGKAIKPGTAKKVAPKPDLAIYQDKSMTATYYSIYNEDKALGKQFWAVVQAEDNASAAWAQYLNGTASKELIDKIDNILLQHKGIGAWSKPESAKVAKELVFKPKYENILTADDLIDADYDAYKEFKKVFLDDMSFSGNKNEYWQYYKAGGLKNDYLDKIFKEKGTAAKATKAPAKATKEIVKETKDLEKAKEQLAIAQGNLDSLGNKVYSGIWKEDVTLADYEAKATSILAKKDYFLDQMDKIKNDPDWMSWMNFDEKQKADMLKKMKTKLAELKDFETKGKIYAQYEKEYKEAAKKVKDLTPVGERFGPEAYTQARKDSAIWARDVRQADDVLREAAGEVWRGATQAEKNAIYDYTTSYHKFNEPLRGIEYGSNKYKGVGKADLNAGYKNNGKQLNALTDLLEKSELPEDQWFQRGVRYDNMDKFFGCDMDLLMNGTQEELEKELLGKTITEYGFMSMGSAKGQGFNNCPILMNIYTPQGTHALYVEPFSHFGAELHERGWGMGLYWDGVKKQSSFGSELETLMQQNTDLTITRIERTRDVLYFDLDVTGQNKPQRWKP